MTDLLAPNQITMTTFLFAFLRCTGFIVSAPILSIDAIPTMFKAGAAGWLAVLVTLSAEPFQTPIANSVQFFLIAAGELAIGLSLGILAQAFFSCIALGGELIGQQAGFAIASVLDPTTNQDTSLMEQVHILIATIVFLAIGGHRIFVGAMLEGFSLLPPGQLTSYQSLADFMRAGMENLRLLFEIGFKIGAPVTITMILVSVSEAVMAKTAPQVNILMIGFGTRILVGVFVMIASAPFIFRVFAVHMMNYEVYVLKLMQSYLVPTGLSPGGA